MRGAVDALIVRRRWGIALSIAVGALVLTGCASSGAAAQRATSEFGPLSATGSGTATTSSREGAPLADSPPADGTSITIAIEGRTLSGSLLENAPASVLVAQLPLTLSFSDYGGQEKIATLPAPLDLTGAPDRAAAPAGTIGYYAPDQGLVLYYDSVGAYPGIVPLGVFDDVEALRDASDGAVDVRVQD